MIPVKEIMVRIRGLSHDKQETGYDDVDIIAAINDAVAFVGRMIKNIRPNLISAEKTGMLNALETDIILDEQVAGILTVQVNGHKIEATKVNCIHNLQLKSPCPRFYYLKNFNTLRLHPIPTESVNYIVVYVPQVKKLNIDDETPYINDFDDIIIEYANARLNMSNEYDMTQEINIIQMLTSQIEGILYQFPQETHDIESYWEYRNHHNDYGKYHNGIKGYW